MPGWTRNPTQMKIIELLREVHLLALKEVERLNLRILELEKQPPAPVTPKQPASPAGIKPPSPTKPPEMLNERQVAEFLNVSVKSLQGWRLFRKGPKFVKIGRAVRYRRRDLEKWVDSCSGSY
jgi:predicted DNA-binding transcriptional regulator AlpA